MAIIGVGYLFPIAAIWAAFDYWKTLFPTTNIEFVVTGAYQLGSVVTVAALSVQQSASLGPRILGGFGGQFVCLAAILAFRFLVVQGSTLLHILVCVVLFCSVATGYLDSALLALCSQYSPKMQQSLQIGIGFGTLVSVAYRDITKLLMAGDVADATSMYFTIALFTVLVCIFSYKLLMSLPVSAHLYHSGDRKASLLPTPPASPMPYACGFSPMSPGKLVDEAGDCGENTLTADGQNGATVDRAVGVDVGFRAVFSLVWKNELAIFLNLVLTTLCYPGLLTSIPCRQLHALNSEHWFQTLLLTMFTLADIVGRFMTHNRFCLAHNNILLTVGIRAAVFPPLLLCIVSASVGDAFSLVVVAAFGFLNGFCVSLALIVINEVPGLSDEQRKTAGRISACSVNSGLCVGSLLAAAIAWTLDIGA